MDWRVDPEDPRSPYDQLRIQVIDAVRSGTLRVGERLPTVRELAASTGVAVNTAARAYRELEAGGIIETRGRSGSFVRAEAGSVDEAAAAYAREYLDRVRAIGIGSDEAAEIVRALGESDA